MTSTDISTDPSWGVEAVIGDGPVGVLLVNLDTREVVHHNPVAQQLAPDVAIPVGLDTWADGAQLRDLVGNVLSRTDHPLSRVARSEPVTGQPVTAARSSDLGEERAGLWVVALPMTGAPMLDDHALVLLIPLRDVGARAAAVAAAEEADRNPGEGASSLGDRAVLATTMSFTVADATAPDQPLVWVNPAFTITTGYALEEVVGRNCRFLQGPGTDPASPAGMRRAIEAGTHVSTTVLNYRRDGSAFWNQVDISPVHDATGALTHLVGIQTDVTLRVEADLARAEALRAEQEARADAERARARLTFLVEAVNRLTGTLDVEECTECLLELVVPTLADWALVFRLDERQHLEALTGRHRDPARQAEVDAYTRDFPGAMRPGGVTDLLLGDRSVRVLSQLDDPASLDERAEYLEDLSMTERSASLGAGTALFVALPGRRRVRDVLALVRAPGSPDFDDDDIDVGLDLGHRVGLILDNARLYEGQHQIAETLQRSLLSEIPDVEGLDIAAHYSAGAREADVGGDFYELLPLPDGAVGVAIGDVIGHDVVAAAAMGQLKGALRALAWTAAPGQQEPAALLGEVDHLLTVLDHGPMASAIYGRLVRTDDGWDLAWANAGHPRPVVRLPDGTVELLGNERGDLMLGVALTERSEQARSLPDGSILVFYTDGLVERRGAALDEGTRAVLDLVATADGDAHDLCRDLMALVPETGDDDVAVLVLRLSGSGPR